MKILIVENEWRYIDTPFHYVNDVYYSNQIEFTNAEKSQDIPFSRLSEFDYVFLDISLARRSDLDGFGIIRKIIDEDLTVNKLIILTGNHLITERLSEKGLPTNYPVITKPIDFEDILKILRADI